MAQRSVYSILGILPWRGLNPHLRCGTRAEQPAQGPENLHGEVNAIHVAVAQHAGAGNLDAHLRNGAQDFCEALLDGISRCGQPEPFVLVVQPVKVFEKGTT